MWKGGAANLLEESSRRSTEYLDVVYFRSSGCSSCRRLCFYAGLEREVGTYHREA